MGDLRSRHTDAATLPAECIMCGELCADDGVSVLCFDCKQERSVRERLDEEDEDV